MRGTVKFFDNAKGWGFISDEKGKDYFVHYSSILMDGRKQLSTEDIVDFEIGTGTTGREQAVNVQPILTLAMIENALKEEKQFIKPVKDAYGAKTYMVVDANNAIQAGEQGMSLIEVAAYAGIDTEGLE